MTKPGPGVAVIIGNSDGIGLAVTKKLLSASYRAIGVSRSACPLDHPALSQHRLDVTASDFGSRLDALISGSGGVDLCIYCAGVGFAFDRSSLEQETETFRVNLMGAAVATEIIVTRMLRQGHGHFIGLSSIMDCGRSAHAPAYAASKSGISAYWEGLDGALAGSGVRVTNVRFGFVDTKMAKAPVRPFMMSSEQAADHIFKLVGRPKRRSTRPRRMALLLWLTGLPGRVRYLGS